MHYPARITLFAAGLGACLILNGCEKPEPAAQTPEQTVTPEASATPLSSVDQQQLKSFLKAGAALPQSLVECTGQLRASMQEFLGEVNAKRLQILRTQWSTCYDIYIAASTLQGYSNNHQAALDQAHSRLGNPLAMPGFIDSVAGYPFSGIVNDASLELSEDELRQQHGLTDQADVSIGFDVVRFLLWGEQVYNKEISAREFTDFTAADHWEDSREDLPIKNHPHNRRRDMLRLTIEMLTADSRRLLSSWDTGELPATEEQATSWEMTQLKAFNSALEQWPDNEALPSHLKSWLEQDELPAIPANLTTITADPASPATPLRAQLKNRLNTLPKVQAKAQD